MSPRREELLASLTAGAASIWFVAVITTEFPRVIQWLPPRGATEVMGLCVLLWLHAKHLRVRAKSNSPEQLNAVAS